MKKGITMIKVLYVNNNGAGFAGVKEVQVGLTLGSFFQMEMGCESPSNYIIKVNGEVQPSSYVLNENDRIVCYPAKFEGGLA